jgi:hypothetical protein
MPARKRATGGGSQAQRYEIRVRGPIGPTTMQAFPTLVAGRSGQDTLLSGSLPDQSAVYGVINQLEALGLQLLEIRRLPTGDPERASQSRDPCEEDSCRPPGGCTSIHDRQEPPMGEADADVHDE